MFLACSKEKNSSPTVTVYVSEDQVFSEPVLKAFEKETRIKIKAIYDSEESKSTGIMNRLLAEKNNPQADVYWANEPIRAEVLRTKGILAPYKSPNAKGIDTVFKQKDDYWNGFSARIRLFVVHNNSKHEPTSIFNYTDPLFQGDAVIANPLFGTTAAHIAALFTILGDAKTKALMEGMKKNDITTSTSNGESADLVAKERYSFSLVDSDDAISRLRQKAPIHFVYPDQKSEEVGAFVIPNTVMLIKDAPHPTQAKQLIDYLLSPQTEERLAFADCAQIPLHKGVKIPKELKPIEQIKVMQVDYSKVAQKLLEIQPYVKAWTNH
jgi:iron(III) transport system substrate-binding protein